MSEDEKIHFGPGPDMESKDVSQDGYRHACFMECNDEPLFQPQQYGPWISANDRPPPPKSNFLGTDGEIVFAAYWMEGTEKYIVGGWESCIYCGGENNVSFLTEDSTTKRITHWMPLPQLPRNNMEWIKVDKFGEMPPERPFLLVDETGRVYEGSTAFEYYDSEYWFPMPKFPFPKEVITNDQWNTLALKKKEENA